MKYIHTDTHCHPIVNPKYAIFKERLEDFKNILAKDLQAIALAAPQIGWNVQVFITRDGMTYINPTIIRKSPKTMMDLEGCRSLPDIGYVPVMRSTEITLEYMDINGNEHIKTFYGFEARVIQHEVDHLNKLMINRKGIGTDK